MAEAVTALDYRGNVTTPALSENSGTATAPTSGQTIVSVPGSGNLAPGVYNVTWETGLAGAAAAGDANNTGLYFNGALLIQAVNPGAAGSWPQEPVQVTSVPGSAAVLSVRAVGAGTASVVYSAQAVATPVLQENADAQNMPWASDPLTANGSTVTIGPLSVVLAGFDATGSQAECQLGRGGNLPSGTSDQGFVDTTYTLTAAQVSAGVMMGA